MMRLTYCLVATAFVGSQLAGCGTNSAREAGPPSREELSGRQLTPENQLNAERTPNEDSADQTPTPSEETLAAKEYAALLEEYESEGGARMFAKRFLKLAEQYPQDSTAVDALLWVVGNVRGKSDTTRALELLTSQHIQDEKLGTAGKQIANARSIAAEKLLRTALEESPHEEVRAHACYHLASLLDLESSLVEQLKAQPELAARVLQYYGKEYGAHLASLALPALEKEREQVYERMHEAFPDAEVDDIKLGAFAEKMLFRIRYLSIGNVAPEIDGEDIDGNRFKLSDYRGKVVMLTFWGHW